MNNDLNTETKTSTGETDPPVKYFLPFRQPLPLRWLALIQERLSHAGVLTAPA